MNRQTQSKEKKYASRVIVSLSGALVMFVLLFIDLITKAWAEGTNAQQTEFFLGLARIYYTRNPGIAYGLFGGNETAMIIVTALTVVMILVIAVVFFTLFRHNAPVRITLAVIEAGAVGNLVDRLLLGYVRDFIDISRVGFGVANLADFFIVLGAVVLVFLLLFIGEDALLPLKKEWRERAREKDAEKTKKKEEKHDDTAV